MPADCRAGFGSRKTAFSSFELAARSDVAPAFLQCVEIRKIAGGTPALRKPLRFHYNQARTIREPEERSTWNRLTS
jgi:hypothetical protein